MKLFLRRLCRSLCIEISLIGGVAYALARIVHEADLADDCYETPEPPGLDVICQGPSMVLGGEEILEIIAPMFDGLYEYRRRAMLLGREPG